MYRCHQLVENNQVLGVADSVGGLSLYGYDDNVVGCRVLLVSFDLLDYLMEIIL